MTIMMTTPNPTATTKMLTVNICPTRCLKCVLVLCA